LLGENIGVKYHEVADEVRGILGNLNYDDYDQYFSLGSYSKNGNFRIQRILETNKNNYILVVDSYDNTSKVYTRLLKSLRKDEMPWIRDFEPDMKKLVAVSSKNVLVSTNEGSHVVFGYRGHGLEYKDVSFPTPVIFLGEDSTIFEEVYKVFKRYDQFMSLEK